MSRIWTHDHCIPFRCSDQLSYQTSFIVCSVSDFISAIVFVSSHVYFNRNFLQVITWVQRNELIHYIQWILNKLILRNILVLYMYICIYIYIYTYSIFLWKDSHKNICSFGTLGGSFFIWQSQMARQGRDTSASVMSRHIATCYSFSECD